MTTGTFGAAAVGAALVLAGCAGHGPVPGTPHAGWEPSSLALFTSEQSPPLCSSDRLPRPRFYEGSAEMRPEDTLAVAELGRCLASPARQRLRVELLGAPDHGQQRAGDRLALERAARVESMLVDSGVAPQRISMTTSHDRPELDGRVAIGVFE